MCKHPLIFKTTKIIGAIIQTIGSVSATIGFCFGYRFRKFGAGSVLGRKDPTSPCADNSRCTKHKKKPEKL